MPFLSSICLFIYLANGLFSCSALEKMIHNSEVWYKYSVDGFNNPVLFKAFEMEQTDFVAAHRNCHNHISHLASFHSVEEFRFISEVLLEQFGPLFSESTWLGLYHKHEELDGLPNFQLYFSDGSEYDVATDENTHSAIWNKLFREHTYEPNGLKHDGSDDVEYCAELVASHLENGQVDYRLNDMVCSNAAPVHVCRYSKSTQDFDEDLPSEVVTGEISPKTQRVLVQAVPNTPPPPPPTPSSPTSPTAKAAVPSPSVTVVQAVHYKSGDTFYFVLFLLAFLVLVLETGYIYWLHRKNPGLNSFTFKNF